MRLIYDGILSRDEASYCEGMSKDYRYAVELSRIPDNAVLEDTLKRRTYWQAGEDCMGETYARERVGIRYGLVQKNLLNGPRDERGNFLGETFLFVVDEEDHAAIVAKLGDTVINANPFKTSLEVRA